ncbi:AAA family ATPase [Nonomuraea sp. NPDC050404]|uniref:helix-turn-helix transcriptional regulator n=1 Tax=Nonomuraea sp. NPDC050404 TaxID=3155783 RepID=UPI0033C3C7D8
MSGRLLAEHDEVFVDRAEELLVLDRALRKPAPGRPRLMVVSGQAGIGKTALIERAVATLPRVLRAAGAETESGLPYGLLTQLTARAPAPRDTMTAGAALAGELTGAEGEEPVVIVADDVQWADHASLEAVSFVLRRPQEVRLVVVMVVRDLHDPALPPAVHRLFNAAGTLRVLLAGLGTAAVADLCAELTGRRPSKPAAIRLSLHTGGNPQHIRALLGRLANAALEDLDTPLPAPAALTLRVLADLATCGPAGRELVAAAAVLGQRCSLHAAAEVARLDDPLPALEEAISAGLLLEVIGAGEVAFPCPMVRTAVYQDHLGPSRRTELHRRAAALTQERPAALRHHCLGSVGPDGKLAAELAELGRERAAEGAWSEAATHLGAATRLATTAGERHRLVLEAAEGRIIMGHAGAGALLSQVRGLPPSAWRAYVLALLMLESGRTDEAGTLLEESWRQADGADPVLAAKVATQQALLRMLNGDVRAAAAWNDRAREPADLPVGLDLASCLSAYTLGLAGRAGDALARLPDLPAPASASVAELEALLGRAMLRLWLDDLPAAALDLHGILAASARLPLRPHLLAHTTLAEIDYHRGDWDGSLAHCQEAAKLADEAGHVLLAPVFHAGLAQVLAGRGEWEAAEAHLRLARESTPHSGGALIRSHAEVAAMRLATARGDFEAVLACPAPGQDLIPWADMLIDALTATGRLEEAEERLDRWEAAARRPSQIAAAARARGNLHAARRQPERARACFERSAALLDRLGMSFALAQTELDHGACLRRSGKRGLAAERLERAYAAFEGFGARAYLRRCVHELAACGVGSRESSPVVAGLTTQESAIAARAARGLTNRQIARELALSVKTVEYHLGNVYLKLRVRSRTQLVLRLNSP